MKPVFLVGATPLVIALGVRLARVNWPLVGLWDADHARALTASLRIGCLAYPHPEEPLVKARWVLVGSEPPSWLPEGPQILATWPTAGSWLEPLEPVTDPGADVTALPFRGGGAVEDWFDRLSLIRV